MNHSVLLTSRSRLELLGYWATRWSKGVIINLAISSSINSVVFGVIEWLHLWLVNFFSLIFLHDHVVNELIRQLTKHCHSQFALSFLSKGVVLHQLDDITNGFVSITICKNLTIGVKNLHLFEVSITYADDDSTERHSR